MSRVTSTLTLTQAAEYALEVAKAWGRGSSRGVASSRHRLVINGTTKRARDR